MNLQLVIIGQTSIIAPTHNSLISLSWQSPSSSSMLAYPTDTTWLSTISKAGRTRSHLVTSETFYSRESSVADTCQTRKKRSHKVLINIITQLLTKKGHLKKKSKKILVLIRNDSKKIKGVCWPSGSVWWDLVRAILHPQCCDIPLLHKELRAERMNNGKHIDRSHTV